MPVTYRSDIINARKCENINDPIDTYGVDYIAMAFTKVFIKLHIIPNVVTILSAITGIAGGIMLCFDRAALNVAGVLTIILSAVFDACDGQVARLTKHYSNLGRTLDGFADFLVYLTIYIALCVRLYSANIPFTQRTWGLWVVPIAVVSLLSYGGQARTADYFKNVHMFMKTRGGKSELSRTSGIEKQIAGTKKFTFEHFRLSTYRLYTDMQEKKTPKTQKLLEKIEENGGYISEELSDAFFEKRRKYVMSTNLLTFNLRTIILFVLIFLPGYPEFWYFTLVIFVFEAIRLVIIAKYEKLAADLTKQNIFENTEATV